MSLGAYPKAGQIKRLLINEREIISGGCNEVSRDRNEAKATTGHEQCGGGVKGIGAGVAGPVAAQCAAQWQGCNACRCWCLGGGGRPHFRGAYRFAAVLTIRLPLDFVLGADGR